MRKEANTRRGFFLIFSKPRVNVNESFIIRSQRTLQELIFSYLHIVYEKTLFLNR